MADVKNLVCTRDKRVHDVYNLAVAGKMADYEKMMEHYALPLNPKDRFDFLNRVKQCFGSERKNHPDLPTFPYIPNIYKIV
jgi:hypothetical protein